MSFFGISWKWLENLKTNVFSIHELNVGNLMPKKYLDSSSFNTVSSFLDASLLIKLKPLKFHQSRFIIHGKLHELAVSCKQMAY